MLTNFALPGDQMKWQFQHFNMRLETCNVFPTNMRTLSVGKLVHHKNEFDLEAAP